MPFRHTRRQALRLGAGAAASLGALRLAPAATAAAAAAGDLVEFPVPVSARSGAVAAGGWRRSPVVRAPGRFDLAGLRWEGRAPAHVELRTRLGDGSWSAWAPLADAADHAPDGAAPPEGTDPAFVGAADALQVRWRGTPHGLRARVLRALPEERPRARARAAATTPQPRAGAAQLSPPPIIGREAWGAPAPGANPYYGTVTMAFVHHTVTTNDYTPEDSAAIVRGIAKYHTQSNGWNDIGYNFLVDKYGQVFEGRAGGIEAAVTGAQAQGWNSVSTGIACLGTFSGVAQTDVALDVLARLIGWKLSIHGVPVQGRQQLPSSGGGSNRWKAGTVATFERISGHRDGCTTTCPGDVLYGQLGDLRARAARYAAPVSALSVATTARQRGAAPVTLGGGLRFADGGPAGGAGLAIEYSAPGGTWAGVGTTTCDGNGAWSAQVTLPATGRVRVVFAGDGAHGRIESAPIAVRVDAALSLATDARRKRAGNAFRVRGAVSPAPALVVCRLERQVGRRWVTVQRKRIPVRGGRYDTQVRAAKAGRYRVTVIAGEVSRSRLLRAIHG